MLTGANSQILEAYENLGMSPEEISDDLDYDIVAVKATLMQFSSKYRSACQVTPNLDFSIDEQLAAKQTMVELMRNTEDEYLRARLAMKIRDDGKGRLDIGIGRGLNINVNLFNMQLKQARERIALSKTQTQPHPELVERNGISQDAEMVEA